MSCSWDLSLIINYSDYSSWPIFTETGFRLVWNCVSDPCFSMRAEVVKKAAGVSRWLIAAAWWIWSSVNKFETLLDFGTCYGVGV